MTFILSINTQSQFFEITKLLNKKAACFFERVNYSWHYIMPQAHNLLISSKHMIYLKGSYEVKKMELS